MSRDKRDILEFLFIGPLLSIYKGINQIRRDVMGLQETVDGIATRLSGVSEELARGLGEVKGKIAELEALVEAGETPDFTAVNAALDNVSGLATALDAIVPDAVSEEPPVEEPPVETPVEGEPV